MLFAKKRFRSKCINNKYMDFGNHTGFRYVERTHEHLTVGEWYEFEVNEYGNALLIIEGLEYHWTGYSFTTPVGRDYTPDVYNFYKFFESLEEMRTNSINDILGDDNR